MIVQNSGCMDDFTVKVNYPYHAETLIKLSFAVAFYFTHFKLIDCYHADERQPIVADGSTKYRRKLLTEMSH